MLKIHKLTLLLAVLISISVQAQKCSYEKNEIDAVTDLMIKITTPQMITRVGGQPVYVKAQSIGDNKYLKIRVYNYSEFDIQENKEISFKLSNEEEIVLYPREMPVDSAQIDSYTNITTLMIYKLSHDQYDKLKSVPVLTFKYFLDSGWVEEKIKEKKQSAIMNVLQCLE